jgi:hypothetical protein
LREKRARLLTYINAPAALDFKGVQPELRQIRRQFLREFFVSVAVGLAARPERYWQGYRLL